MRRLGFTLPVLADEIRFLVVFRDPRARVLSAVDYFKRRFNASAPAGKTTHGFDRELVLAHAHELIDEVALHTAVRFVVHREAVYVRPRFPRVAVCLRAGWRLERVARGLPQRNRSAAQRFKCESIL